MKKTLQFIGICVVILIAVSCVSTSKSDDSGKPKIMYAPKNPGEGVIVVNDNTIGSGLNEFEYIPEWNYGPGGGKKYKNDDHYSGGIGAIFQVRFKGTNIKVYGTLDMHHGDAKASIDGGKETMVTYKNMQRLFQVLIFDSGELEPGEHILKVEVVGTGVVTADRVDITE